MAIKTEEFSKTVRFSPIVPSKNTELPCISSVHEKCEEIGHIRDKLREKIEHLKNASIQRDKYISEILNK